MFQLHEITKLQMQREAHSRQMKIFKQAIMANLAVQYGQSTEKE
jgi:hypothetical protein